MPWSITRNCLAYLSDKCLCYFILLTFESIEFHLNNEVLSFKKTADIDQINTLQKVALYIGLRYMYLLQVNFVEQQSLFLGSDSMRILWAHTSIRHEEYGRGRGEGVMTAVLWPNSVKNHLVKWVRSRRGEGGRLWDTGELRLSDRRHWWQEWLGDRWAFPLISFPRWRYSPWRLSFVLEPGVNHVD